MGQWEYQIFAKGAASAGDQIWLACNFLERTAETYDIAIDLHPKPIKETGMVGMPTSQTVPCVNKVVNLFRKSARSLQKHRSSHQCLWC